MHHNSEELILLEQLRKGRKARTSPALGDHFKQDKYQYYSKSQRGNNNPHIPTTEDMLQTASRKTQAIFKISSFGKGTKRIAAHLSYISRHNKLQLEDQNGNKIMSLNDQKEKLADWATDFGDNLRSRDTMHLVLSTPSGTNPAITQQAAKEFLEKEFKQSGHEYLFVQHNDTDHPHVHAVIKMVSCYGNKLNPRKAYLHSVRQHFATICRSHAIQVEASSRAERGLSGRSSKSEFVQMRRSGRKPQADINLMNKIKAERESNKLPKHPSEEKIRTRNQIIQKRYAQRSMEMAMSARGLPSKIEYEKSLREAKSLHRYPKLLQEQRSSMFQLESHVNLTGSSVIEYD
jgi:hypothetical protein